jgi:four helix bundle protein
MEKPHKRLDAWKLGIELVVEVCRLTRTFPDEERYALTVQMRRSVVSIPSNIAEGAARNTKKEFAHYLHIAQASLSELDTHLEVAERLGYVPDNARKGVDVLMVRIDKLVSGLIKSIKTPYPSPLTRNAGKGT